MLPQSVADSGSLWRGSGGCLGGVAGDSGRDKRDRQ